MRKHSTNLLVSWLAVLLMSSVACVRASFVPSADAAGGAGAGGVGGSASGGQTAGAGGGAGAGSTCPAPTCPTTATDTCDPVLQACGTCDYCSKKCTYALVGGTAQATCTANDPSPRNVTQSCNVTYSGSSTQSDNCQPKNICLQPINGGNPGVGYCFALCRSAVQDCSGGVACTPRSLSSQGGTVNVCDPPYNSCGPSGTGCNPLAAAGSADSGPNSCPSGRYCLLVPPDSSEDSRTTCEFSTGTGKNGAGCNSAHDCDFAYTCVNDGPHNGCHRVCNPANPCPAGAGTCLWWGNEYGFCSTG
jgi:hypothetical protein